jgi:hypothetical protein
MPASGTERTCYLIGTVIFIFALGAMLIAFDAFMPKSYFGWMQRHRWGREVVGMLMLGIALAAGSVAFCLIR